MPVTPKAPKKEAKATAITKKSNLASKEHQALLEWLIQDLTNLCDVMRGQGNDWFDETTAKALKDFHENNNSLLEGLERGSADESLPSEYRNACSAKLKWARAFFKKVGTPSLLDYQTASCPIVEEWNAQARIFTKREYVNGRTIEPKPAGFVDLQVLLAIPNGFEVNCFDTQQSDIGTSYHARRDNGTETVANFKIHDPAWSYENFGGLQYHRVWFDVWAELPPIGELLQHLKMLSELNCSYRDTHLKKSTGNVETSVVLVVPAISESLQSIIEHEGFDVLSKQWYESAD